MTILTKIIVATILSLTLFSCNFDIGYNRGVRGNGNVIEENRPITNSFNEIIASEGLQVYLTQSDVASITVEADENLQDLIITEVIDNVLKIHTKQNIGKASSKKVLVSFNDVTKISSMSGSDVFSTNTINAENLELNTSSGSDMEILVNTKKLNCNSSSGSDLHITGETDWLIVEASSGSDIKAAKLNAKSSQVKASSGADITVNTSEQLTAKASSGGDIKYYGNPEKIEKSDNVSGSIRKL